MVMPFQYTGSGMNPDGMIALLNYRVNVHQIISNVLKLTLFILIRRMALPVRVWNFNATGKH